MNDISIGAVGAAIIAGLVSLLGLIIGKEQKVSEFRQAWIEELRKCLISYLSNINAISDLLQIEKAGQPRDDKAKMARIQALNEASHGISLRINASEKPARALLAAMSDFEGIGLNSASLTPDRIKIVEKEFVKASKKLLKFEWKRVKRGEDIFVWTKRVVILTVALLLVLLGYLYHEKPTETGSKAGFTPLPYFTR